VTTDLPSGPAGGGSGTALPGDHRPVSTGLRAGAVGLGGVRLRAVATAAPITAMSFNVPIAVGFGNGLGAPAGFLFATLVLTLFTVGYVAMARHITTAGAFMGFISHGLGQIAGMASGLLATVAYVIFEGSLIGGFSYFAADTLHSSFDVTVHWMWFAVLGTLLIGLLTYFSITLTAAVLSVTLVSEVLLLLALGLSVLFRGGGPDGLLFGDTVPLVPAFTGLEPHAFGTSAAAGIAAIGIFFSFWSWVGYETTAVYGEESKDPKRIVPRATLIAVVGLGLFYTFMSWMVIAGQGRRAAVEYSISASPVDLWLTLVKANLGGFALGVYKLLLVVGSFACAMAFHNAASRYLYAIGREMPWAGVRRTLGSTHPTHRSPATASWLQSGITLLLMVLFFLFTSVSVADAAGNPVDTPDLVPYVNAYGLLALIGTAMILIVQTICSVAVISYFWGRRTHRGNVLTTLVCPAVGGLGMIYALVLLWQNREFAAGAGAGSRIFTLMPVYVVLTLLVGVGYALWLRNRHPAGYGAIGRTTLEEAHER
jgi:amino acid transporter